MDVDNARFERVPLTEWSRLRAMLEEFGSGDVEVEGTGASESVSGGNGSSGEDEQLVCQFGRATFTVSRGGAVEAGMPLHGFTASNVEAIGVDTQAGEFLVETGESRYVFRRP